MPTIRVLKPGDEAALEAFVLPRAESSMFLLSNMRQVGLVDRGGRFEGTYVAAFEQGEIIGVAAHYWNGNLILQTPVEVAALHSRQAAALYSRQAATLHSRQAATLHSRCIAELCRAALEASGRRLAGMLGPEEQVGAATQALGLEAEPLRLDESEYLYGLALADLKVPEALALGEVRGRRIERRDVNLVTAWRVQFSVESLGDEETPKLWEACRESVERSMVQGWLWVLEVEGQPVATSAFNAATGEMAQLGGVWTPPELRSRGYGRSVVAASLLDGREEGVETAILFTGKENLPAQKAYAALGFNRVGSYRMFFLQKPLTCLPARVEIDGG